MSRRHHGRPHHHARPKTGEAPRPTNGTAGAATSSEPPAPSSLSSTTAATDGHRDGGSASSETRASATGAPRPASIASPPAGERTRPALDDAARFAAHIGARSGGTVAPVEPGSAPPPVAVAPPPVATAHHRGRAPGPASGPTNGAHRDALNGCTAPQLRRFIKSRPYVPMHELRRRFAINGEDDDVTPVSVEAGAIFVGLPEREGRLLGDLVRGGEVGYELSLDPRTPIVIGVYPMRPIPRT